MLACGALGCDALACGPIQLVLGVRTWSITFTRPRLFEVCVRAGLLEVGLVQPLKVLGSLRKARAARRIVSFVATLKQRRLGGAIATPRPRGSATGPGTPGASWPPASALAGAKPQARTGVARVCSIPRVAVCAVVALLVSLLLVVVTEDPLTVLLGGALVTVVTLALLYLVTRLLAYGLLPGRLLLEQKKPNLDLVRSQLSLLLMRSAALQSMDVLNLLELSAMRCSAQLPPSFKEGFVEYSHHNRWEWETKSWRRGSFLCIECACSRRRYHNWQKVRRGAG
jgi:hypothetical protein